MRQTGARSRTQRGIAAAVVPRDGQHPFLALAGKGLRGNGLVAPSLMGAMIRFVRKLHATVEPFGAGTADRARMGRTFTWWGQLDPDRDAR